MEYVHSKVDPRPRGELISLKTKEHRTIYFDFTQMEMGQIKGFKPKFDLHTVPDQVIYVADSQADKMKASIEMIQSLEENLRELGYNPLDVPLGLQFNKRGLRDAIPVEVLRSHLARDGCLQFEAVAIRGQGVIDTLKAAINLVVARI